MPLSVDNLWDYAWGGSAAASQDWTTNNHYPFRWGSVASKTCINPKRILGVAIVTQDPT